MRIYEFYDDNTNFYIVSELCQSGLIAITNGDYDTCN